MTQSSPLQDAMTVCICDSEEHCVARLILRGQKLVVEGEFPGGLTAEDLETLGFVYYETSQRGELVARVQEVPLSNSLDYLRALIDALPPGYHISQVDSDTIAAERQERRKRFEAEMSLMNEPDEE